jgi:hypothetical protein
LADEFTNDAAMVTADFILRHSHWIHHGRPWPADAQPSGLYSWFNTS